MTAPVIDLAAARRAEAEVEWYEYLLERLRTVDGAWIDWDWRMRCPDRQEKAAEECAEALRLARKRLAEASKADGGER